jgi:hypothetical protein
MPRNYLIQEETANASHEPLARNCSRLVVPSLAAKLLSSLRKIRKVWRKTYTFLSLKKVDASLVGNKHRLF